MVMPRCRRSATAMFGLVVLGAWLSGDRAGRLQAAEPRVPQQGVLRDDAPLPKGAISRLGTTRFRGNNEAGAVFLSDGRTVVTTGGLWNVETGGRVGDAPFNDDVTRCIAHSRDRRTIATLGFKFDREGARMLHRVQLWNDALERKAIVEWVHGDGEPTCLALSDDERVVVVADSRGVLKTFNVETQTKLSETYVTLPGPGDRRVEGLAISPDGKTLAVARSGGVSLLDLRDQEAEPRNLVSPGRTVKSVAFSPDGTLLAGGEDGLVAARVWDVKSGALVKTLKTPIDKYYYPSRLAFMADGRRLIVPTNSATEIWNIKTGEVEHSLSTGNRDSRTVDISPDEEWLVAGGSWDIVISAWHLPTLRPLELPAGHTGPVASMAFSPDGATVFTASDDGTVRTWNAATGTPLHVMEHRKWVRAMAVSPDGSKVASSSLDDTVAVWDATTGQQVYSLFGHGKLGGHRSLAFSRDSSRLFSFGDDGNLRIWEMRTGKALAEHRLAGGLSEDRLGVQTGPSGAFLLGGERILLGDGRVLETASGKEVGHGLPGHREFGWLDQALSPDGALLAKIQYSPTQRIPLATGGIRVEGGREPTFQLFNAAGGIPKLEFPLPGRGIAPVAFSPDGTLVATGCGEDVHVFDCASGELRFHVTGLPTGPSRLAISPDRTTIAVSHRDTTVTLWPLGDFAVTGAAR